MTLALEVIEATTPGGMMVAVARVGGAITSEPDDESDDIFAVMFGFMTQRDSRIVMDLRGITAVDDEGFVALAGSLLLFSSQGGAVMADRPREPPSEDGWECYEVVPLDDKEEGSESWICIKTDFKRHVVLIRTSDGAEWSITFEEYNAVAEQIRRSMIA